MTPISPSSKLSQIWPKLIVTALFFATAALLFNLLYKNFDVKAPGLGQFSDSRGVKVPLEVFQVEAPLRRNYDGAACKQVVVQHDFAASYGTPFVGYYRPPSNCTFTTTIFNMSITSIGINYDRLGLLFVGDIEVWRSTTAMPVRTGIFYNFQKDLTIYDTLLRSEQKIIMQLDNIYDSTFTGSFNVTITALYYNDPVILSPAHLILPISTQSSNQNASSVFSLPDDNASVALTLPRNSERAVVSILASGNGAEEFWYAKTPTGYKNGTNTLTSYGSGPFREVQLLIDGKLAGSIWPSPTIFTGGISPGLWVPIVGIDTYDLPSFEIDVSPWLGLLCDGKDHSFEFKVVSYNSATVVGTVGSNWWVSGSVFVWLDRAGIQTKSTLLESFTPSPIFNLTSNITNSNNTSSCWMQLTAERTLSYSSQITTSSGTKNLTWSQSLTYVNTQNYVPTLHTKTVSQITNGTSILSATSIDSAKIANTFSYPLLFVQTYLIPADAASRNSTIIANLDRSVLSSTVPILSYLTMPTRYNVHATLSTRQNGSCTYYWNDTYYQFAGAIDPAMGSYGGTEQWLSSTATVSDGGVQSYSRHIKAIDGYEPILLLDDVFEVAIEVPATEYVLRYELLPYTNHIPV